MTYANGVVYEGEWTNDFWHGKGKISFADQNVYEGNFVIGIQHGK